MVRDLCLREGEDSLNDLRRKVRRDLCHFEGNAQGIRLVHSLMRMNLTGRWAVFLNTRVPHGGPEKRPPRIAT